MSLSANRNIGVKRNRMSRCRGWRQRDATGLWWGEEPCDRGTQRAVPVRTRHSATNDIRGWGIWEVALLPGKH